MKVNRLDPPAFLNDFSTENQRNEWSSQVEGYFTEGVQFNGGFAGVTSQFYDPVTTDTDDPHTEQLISWPGFPKLVEDRFPTNPDKAFDTAETGANARITFMDEYLEWHVVRNAAGKITRVSFTCETTQYYEFLAKTDKNKLLQIYQDLVDPAFKAQVKLSDLIVGSTYNPRNKWNTEHGAIHLIHPMNNLFAEVMIAAQACILRKRSDSTVITDSDELIRCSGYGTAGRASDPKIGAIVNQEIRKGSSLTLRNPVALYIASFSSAGLKKPNGTPVDNYWKLVRGTSSPSPNKPGMGLHLAYEVPATEGFVVGDIKIGTKNIKFGGQLAKNVMVGLVAVVCREGKSHNPPFLCGVQPAAPQLLSLAPEAVTLPMRGHKDIED